MTESTIGSLEEAQDEWDAGLDKAEERRIWVENTSQGIMDGMADAGCAAVAWETADPTQALGVLLTIIRTGQMDIAHDYAYTLMQKYADANAEELAKDNGY